MSLTHPRAKRAAALAFATCVALIAFAGSAFAASPYPVHTLAESSDRQGGMSVGIDAEGNQVAVWTTSFESGERVVEASVRPSGGSWSAPTQISPGGAESWKPDVAVNASGEAIAVWQQDPAEKIEASRLDDIRSDTSWTTPIEISPTGVPTTEAQVALDGAGVATASWRQKVGSNFGAAVASESNGSWETSQVLSNPSESNEAPELAVDAAGDAVLAWERSTAIEAATRPAGGSWSAAEPLATEVTQGLTNVVAGIDDSGEATVAWQHKQFNLGSPEIMAATKPLGGSWSTQLLTVVVSGAPEPSITVTPGGHTLLTWIDESASRELATIEFAERDAGGAWSAPQQIPPPTGDREIYGVSAGVDAAGNVTVAYQAYDYAGADYPVWLNRRAAGGSWTDATRLTEPGEMVYETPVFAVDPEGDLVLGFAGENPTPLYFAKTISIDNNARLDVAKDGAGSGTVTDDLGKIDCGTACAARYMLGTQVTLTATPAAGSEFTGWSGDCSGTGTCTVSIDAAKSVRAEFSPEKKSTPPTDPTTTPTDSSSPTKSTSPAPGAAAPGGPLKLVKVQRSKASGTGASRYWVPAAGKLTVFGKGVKKRTVTVSTPGFKLVKLIPKGAYRAYLRKNHRGYTVVKAQFRPAAGGPAVNQTRRVRLVWRHG